MYGELDVHGRSIGVKPIRLNAQIKRGLTTIVRAVVEDFDNGFDKMFAEITEAETVDLTAALEWLEQFTNEILE